MIVVWQITERCNLSCPFCLYDKRRSGKRREADIKAVLRFAHLLGQYRQKYDERVLISWLGGEPLLWSPLFPLSRHLRKQYDVQFSVTTNGSSLHRAVIQEQVLACLSELTISVDGFAEQHNKLRGWPNGLQSLRAATRQLSRNARAGSAALKLRVNTVLMHDNVRLFADLCRELCSWGIHEITFNQLGGRDRPEFYPEHRLQPEDALFLVDMIPALREELSRAGVILCGDERYLQRIEASSRDIKIPVHDCRSGERFLFIDELGRVSLCSFTAQSLGISINECKHADEIAALPLHFPVARQVHLPAPCDNCTSTRVFAKFTS
jgi:MoaA/NifB/PqqE/SkfB family radical SAM enzyme